MGRGHHVTNETNCGIGVTSQLCSKSDIFPPVILGFSGIVLVLISDMF